MKSAHLFAIALAASTAVAGPFGPRDINARHYTVTVTKHVDIDSEPTGRPGRFPSGWWSDMMKLGAAVTSQTTPSTPSSTPAEFYSAAPTTTSEGATTANQPTTTSQITSSSSSTTWSSQPTPVVSNQDISFPGKGVFEGDEPYSRSYSQPILDAHNSHRWNHSVPNLKWSRKMEEAAKQISESCYYAHSSAGGDGNYGQNIGAGATAQNVNALITNLMYNNETELYPGPYGSEPDMTNFEPWGHYSQIVWASTTEVGCYTNDCSAQGLRNIGPHVGPQFTVCNYYPPGNMGGEYGKNVPAPGHKLPMITINESS